ncbi:Acetone carboxylase gamma subunit [Thalassovita litoralis]|jgi:acetone carboxylase gamma subunit|uniref:Acetone carboxylase gamma subunit n=1 Tax=Thalassovita litoralis TaxID=1010611 RepID=A0A521F554_9RHOB|nr:acetone carboxylase subunit gamma [Thalassovita litoralis]SMO90650.1 Acetone carboxylase gamma subunit [Thalassovita litoralis]
MKIQVTEYLVIDLQHEHWECKCCGHKLISAHENYKKGTLIHARDPREVHRPLIDDKSFDYTFAPDPELCVIYEFYCPGCGTMIETEYQVPGHMPVHDIELDIDALKAQWAKRGPQVLDRGSDADFPSDRPQF